MPNVNSQVSSMRFEYFEPNIPIAIDGNTSTCHEASVVNKYESFKGFLQKVQHWYHFIELSCVREAFALLQLTIKIKLI